jgi:hypothetical protein
MDTHIAFVIQALKGIAPTSACNHHQTSTKAETPVCTVAVIILTDLKSVVKTCVQSNTISIPFTEFTPPSIVFVPYRSDSGNDRLYVATEPSLPKVLKTRPGANFDPGETRELLIVSDVRVLRTRLRRASSVGPILQSNDPSNSPKSFVNGIGPVPSIHELVSLSASIDKCALT